MSCNAARYSVTKVLVLVSGVGFFFLWALQQLGHPIFFALMVTGVLTAFYLKWPRNYWVRFLFVAHFAVYIWLYYEGSGQVIRALGLSDRDATLIRVEQSVFGGIFPEGQIWTAPLKLENIS